MGSLEEAMLSYWLSWFVFSSRPEDGIHPFVFMMAIVLAKGERFALAPIYLGSLYVRLHECVNT